jgi:hypothetical protein
MIKLGKAPASAMPVPLNSLHRSQIISGVSPKTSKKLDQRFQRRVLDFSQGGK